MFLIKQIQLWNVMWQASCYASNLKQTLIYLPKIMINNLILISRNQSLKWMPDKSKDKLLFQLLMPCTWTMYFGQSVNWLCAELAYLTVWQPLGPLEELPGPRSAAWFGGATKGQAQFVVGQEGWRFLHCLKYIYKVQRELTTFQGEVEKLFG